MGIESIIGYIIGIVIIGLVIMGFLAVILVCVRSLQIDPDEPLFTITFQFKSDEEKKTDEEKKMDGD